MFYTAIFYIYYLNSSDWKWVIYSTLFNDSIILIRDTFAALKLLDEAPARFAEDERRLEHDRFRLRRGIKNPSHCQTDTSRGHLFNGQLDC